MCEDILEKIIRLYHNISVAKLNGSVYEYIFSFSV